MRARPAPSASRTLISRCRRAPRASISVAMLAHASSRTSPRKIINTAMGVANACCCANRPRLPSRNISLGTASPAWIGTIARTIVENCASSVACAVRSLTPGFARPRTLTAAGRGIREPVPAVGGGRHERRLRQRDDHRPASAEGSVLAAPGEAFGIHADDRHRDIVELDRPSERGRRPGEFAIPEVVADHDDRVAAGGVVGRTNPAADLRPDAEHVVVVARDFVQRARAPRCRRPSRSPPSRETPADPRAPCSARAAVRRRDRRSWHPSS